MSKKNKKKQPGSIRAVRDVLQNLIGKPDDKRLQQCIDSLTTWLNDHPPVHRPPRMPNWLM